MSRDPGALSDHPSPEAETLSSWATAFLLFAGPLAWWAQLCIGYGLSSWSCYPRDVPLAAPVAGYGWARTAALLLLLACALVAAASALAAWIVYRRVGAEKGGSDAGLMHHGHGRTRFVALWGIILGLGFTVATLATLAAFALVPRCFV